MFRPKRDASKSGNGARIGEEREVRRTGDPKGKGRKTRERERERWHREASGRRKTRENKAAEESRRRKKNEGAVSWWKLF